MHRIILDTDLAMGAPGSDIDDGFALAFAAADPTIEVEMVTTVNGNTDVTTATLLSAELMQRLGVTAPLYKGAQSPLTRANRRSTPTKSTLDDYGHHRPSDGYAPVEIVRHVMAEPGKISIVAIGPLTNIALALALEPGLASAVREIVVMGGMFLGQTNEAGRPGEFNVFADPEAAAAVLRSGARLRFVGLDVTRKVRLTREDASRLASDGRPFGRFASAHTLAWIELEHSRHPGNAALEDSCAMHDPLAIAALSHPELLSWAPAFVTVVTDSDAARGITVTDLLDSVDARQPNCQIAVDVDVAAFMTYFVDAISAL